MFIISKLSMGCRSTKLVVTTEPSWSIIPKAVNLFTNSFRTTFTCSRYSCRACLTGFIVKCNTRVVAGLYSPLATLTSSASFCFISLLYSFTISAFCWSRSSSNVFNFVTFDLVDVNLKQQSKQSNKINNIEKKD